MKVLRPLLLIVTMAVVSFFLTRRLLAQNPKNESKYNPKKDTVVSPRRQNIVETLILAGSIDAQTKAELKFPTSGLLNWVGVKQGDFVKKGQAIASLNKDELKKQYQKDMNDYLTNRWNFEDTQDEYKTTKEKYLVTDEIKRILERANFSLSNAVLDVEIQNIAIKNATIYTPISGLVTDIDQPYAGVNITPTTATFGIIDPQSLFFKSEIDQKDVSRVNPGQKVIIKLDSFPDQPYESKINYIAFTPIPGQTSTVYEIRFDLPVNNNDLSYRLGMDGNAVITLKKADNSLTVPVEAIFENEQTKYVLIKTESDRVIQQPVKTGIESDTDTEILEGLTETDQVVIRKSS